MTDPERNSASLVQECSQPPRMYYKQARLIFIVQLVGYFSLFYAT